jgi:hypothetical protein
MRNLRLPGVLIAVGYLAIAAGTVAWLVAPSYVGNPWEIYVSESAPIVGYGLAGFACWRWIVRFQATNADPFHGAPSRWMAAASVVTAAGWAAITYFYYQLHQNLVHERPPGGYSSFVLDPHYRLRMAGGLSIVVGLLLAGAGFWIVSGRTGTATEPIEAAIPVS